MSGPQGVRIVPKPWGHEVIWAETPLYVGKVLHIKAGQALSVQYHNEKDETIHLLHGEMIYRVADRAGDVLRELPLRAGESFR
ncbi:MAG TPA: hypothetical protein VGT98_15195, partial [Candidatus Elarobacter sp.]|nr:hypothetical protein [Candidatus Elarobacter sp.]